MRKIVMINQTNPAIIKIRPNFTPEIPLCFLNSTCPHIGVTIAENANGTTMSAVEEVNGTFRTLLSLTSGLFTIVVV
jgi:hypothetical protein